MVYARCGYCSQIVPLWCCGQFMAHAPVPPVATPTGVVLDVRRAAADLLCRFCGCRQYLVVQGAQPPAGIGQAKAVAAAVTAPPNASSNTLNQAFGEFAKSFAGGMGEQLAQIIGGAFR